MKKKQIIERINARIDELSEATGVDRDEEWEIFGQIEGLKEAIEIIAEESEMIDATTKSEKGKTYIDQKNNGKTLKIYVDGQLMTERDILSAGIKLTTKESDNWKNYVSGEKTGTIDPKSML